MAEQKYDDWNDPELPDILSAARDVTTTSKSPEERGLTKRLREEYERDTLKFLVWMKGLEKDWQDYKVNRAKAMMKAEEDKPDVGTQAQVELAEKLIRELAEKHK